jgi:hypothetical protein
MYRSVLGDFASREAEEFYLAVMRRMTPEQKWRAAIELWELAVEFARAGVRSSHPDWPEVQVRNEVTRRILESHGTTARLPVPNH